MKKTMTIIAAAVCTLHAKAQFTQDFETFTLSPNSAYTNTNNVPFQDASVLFPHIWSSGYWYSGFAYTNIYDSATAGFNNLYGVKALKGRNNSSTFVIGNANSVIRIKTAQTSVHGFYLTNTTYAYKSMLSGDSYAKKFGGTGGNDPDYFKLVVKGYFNGQLKTDSVEAYLADFRFANNAQDYILDNWSYVNTAPLGVLDSMLFIQRSSDNGQFGMNTPAYFAIDDLTTGAPLTGINEDEVRTATNIFPNPSKDRVSIVSEGFTGFLSVKLYNMQGNLVLEKEGPDGSVIIDMKELSSGVYTVETNANGKRTFKKVIRNR